MKPSAARQGLEALVPGLVVGVLIGLFLRPSFGVLAGYDAGVAFYLARVWLTIWPRDAAATASLAAREDPSTAAADAILLLAAVSSLAAVAVVIARSRSTHGSVEGAQIGLSIASVVISWLLVHTIFTLKYARLYYRGGAGKEEGGIDFENKVRPPYSDFAYLSFTIGMTFQVSDTDLQSAQFRRLALRHALLSYLFGAVIVAATVNLIASLAG